MRCGGSTNKRGRKLIAGHGPGDDSVRLAAGRSSPAIKPAVRDRMTSMHSTRDVPKRGKPVAVNLPLDPSHMANQRTDNKGCNNHPGRRQAAPRRAADPGVSLQARKTSQTFDGEPSRPLAVSEPSISTAVTASTRFRARCGLSTTPRLTQLGCLLTTWENRPDFEKNLENRTRHAITLSGDSRQMRVTLRVGRAYGASR